MGKYSNLFIIIIFLIMLPIPFMAYMFSELTDKTDIMNPIFRDYKIKDADIHIELDNDGNMYLNETIDYRLKGCFRELYKTLNIYNEQYYNLDYSIYKGNDPYIHYINGSCTREFKTHDRGYEFACEMISTCDTNVSLNIDTHIRNPIVIGNDVAEFHYKIWGDDWEKNLQNINVVIDLPEGIDKENTIVYVNPKGYTNDYEIKNNQLSISAKDINTYFEVRILMPKEAFNTENKNSYFLYNPGLTKKDIIRTQGWDSVKYFIFTIPIIILSIAIIILMVFFPIYVFMKYGREPKIDYNAVYEREPIKGIKPYIINSFCMGIGNTNNNAVTATLLDLIRRKHISIYNTKIKKMFGTKDDFILEFNLKASEKDPLSPPERVVFDFYYSYAKNGKIVMSELTLWLNKNENANTYIKMTEDFEKKVDEEYNIEKYFLNKGNKMFKTFAIILLISSVIVFFISRTGFILDNPMLNYLTVFSFIAFTYSLACLAIPKSVFGQFTEEGYLIYKKSMNFKKYMTDMTLLKNYPPGSIVIWNEILVYATLFGVGNKVIKLIGMSLSEKQIEGSHMRPLYSMPAIKSIGSSYSTAQSTVSRSSSGGGRGGFSGGGRSGGGFGGGGGGAR